MNPRRRAGLAERSRPWRWFRSVLLLAALALLAWTGGLVWYATDIPRAVEDVETATDAIVVLTGGSERLGAGIALLRKGLGARLFISGVHRTVDIQELLRQSQPPAEDLAPLIVLGHAADNTVGNAAETAAWMRAERFRSLRLVTANYHMRRSLEEFRWAMPGVAILPHPVFPDKVRRDDWWMWPGTAQLIASEYVKYLAARLRHWAETVEILS